MADEYIRKQDAFDAVEARIAELMTHPEFRRKHLDIDLSGVIRNISAIKPADVVPVVRCKDCIHNNDCDIQYSAQAGENFFCGFGETEKDVREDVYE